jgi:hypothetical protein
MGELIGFVSVVMSIAGEVIGIVLDEESDWRRGKVGRRRAYTSLGLNRLRRGDNSSKQERILISVKDSPHVGKKY